MNNTVTKAGYWSGIIAFVAIVLFFIVQLLQVMGFLHYPWDEILIYGFSLCICIPFMIAMLALHYVAPADKKFWSHGALIFTVLYVAFVTANYVVQLATVIPMTMRGRGTEISILAQTPHSLFWNFDAIGYLFMGMATLFAVPVFEKSVPQKCVRFSFILHAFTTPLIAFVYFYPNFSNGLLLIAIPWAFTAPGAMLLLALYFRKNIKEQSNRKDLKFSILKKPKVLEKL